MTDALPDNVKEPEAAAPVDAEAVPAQVVPRSAPAKAVRPAGSSSSRRAVGAAASGRVGRTYVPEPEAPRPVVPEPAVAESVESDPVAPQPATAGTDALEEAAQVDEPESADEISHGRGSMDTSAAVSAPRRVHPADVPVEGSAGPARQAALGRPTASAGPTGRVASRTSPPAARSRTGVRRARLRLTRIDPWSALKVSLVFAAILFIAWMIAVLVLFTILQGAGVFDSVNSTLTDVFGAHVDFSGALILGGAAVIGALSVVITTALGTVVAFAYNVTASLLGGLDVTLTEQE